MKNKAIKHDLLELPPIPDEIDIEDIKKINDLVQHLITINQDAWDASNYTRSHISKGYANLKQGVRDRIKAMKSRQRSVFEDECSLPTLTDVYDKLKCKTTIKGGSKLFNNLYDAGIDLQWALKVTNS
jgi:hypothetical protein